MLQSTTSSPLPPPPRPGGLLQFLVLRLGHPRPPPPAPSLAPSWTPSWALSLVLSWMLTMASASGETGPVGGGGRPGWDKDQQGMLNLLIADLDRSAELRIRLDLRSLRLAERARGSQLLLDDPQVRTRLDAIAEVLRERSLSDSFCTGSDLLDYPILSCLDADGVTAMQGAGGNRVLLKSIPAAEPPQQLVCSAQTDVPENDHHALDPRTRAEQLEDAQAPLLGSWDAGPWLSCIRDQVDGHHPIPPGIAAALPDWATAMPFLCVAAGINADGWWARSRLSGCGLMPLKAGAPGLERWYGAALPDGVVVAAVSLDQRWFIQLAAQRADQGLAPAPLLAILTDPLLTGEVVMLAKPDADGPQVAIEASLSDDQPGRTRLHLLLDRCCVPGVRNDQGMEQWTCQSVLGPLAISLQHQVLALSSPGVARLSSLLPGMPSPAPSPGSGARAGGDARAGIHPVAVVRGDTSQWLRLAYPLLAALLPSQPAPLDCEARRALRYLATSALREAARIQGSDHVATLFFEVKRALLLLLRPHDLTPAMVAVFSNCRSPQLEAHGKALRALVVYRLADGYHIAEDTAPATSLALRQRDDGSGRMVDPQAEDGLCEALDLGAVQARIGSLSPVYGAPLDHLELAPIGGFPSYSRAWLPGLPALERHGSSYRLHIIAEPSGLVITEQGAAVVGPLLLALACADGS